MKLSFTFDQTQLSWQVSKRVSAEQCHLTVSPRVVTKISSCRVNTTSRRGIKQLGIYHSHFCICRRNPMVLPFKWNLFSSTFTWYYYLVCSSNFWVCGWFIGYCKTGVWLYLCHQFPDCLLCTSLLIRQYFIGFSQFIELFYFLHNLCMLSCSLCVHFRLCSLLCYVLL